MAEIVTIVKNGRIELPSDLRLPDGTEVRLVWNDSASKLPPYDREELSEEDVRADLRWANGKRFTK
jgi:hypothetical protein